MKIKILLFVNLLLPFVVFSQTLHSISPSTANAGETLTVSITGKGTAFKQATGTAVVLGVNGAVTNSVTTVNDSLIQASITLPSTAYTGNYDVTVTQINVLPKILSKSFHVKGVLPPALKAIAPAIANAGQTLEVTITGRNTHFSTNGNNIVEFGFGPGSGTTVANLTTPINDTVLKASITVPVNVHNGTYPVLVKNSTDGSMALQNAFQIKGSGCYAFFNTSYDLPTNVFALTLDSASSKATSFYWDFGDGTTSIDPFPSHVFTEDKIYNVCLQTTNIAGDSCRYCHKIGKDSLGNPIFKAKGFSMYAKPYKELTTGILPIDNNEHFISIYPNPADDLIIISSSTPISELNKPILSIYSIDGKLLLQQAFVKEKMMLDVSAFQKGMYIMQLTGSKQTRTIKFVKE